MAEKQAKTDMEKASESLERMQLFDVATLPREGELGEHFSFKEAVPPARKLLDLYKRLSLSILDDLPKNQLEQIQNQAQQDYSRLKQILEFDPAQNNAKATHDSLIQQLADAYQTAFNTLHPLISYSLHKSADFQRLEGDARAALQTIKDEAAEVTAELTNSRDQAADILAETRRVAAEQGVTQQAVYFKDSADNHEIEAEKWQWITIWTAVGLGLYSALSLFLHKIPILVPTNTYDTVQLAVSKVLLFTVISFVLYLAARNFISHKHNAIVDRHRQNALMTYRALVDAAGDTPNREVILVQAAACIFGAQGTGYTQDSTPKPPGAQSVIEFITQPLKGGD